MAAPDVLNLVALAKSQPGQEVKALAGDVRALWLEPETPPLALGAPSVWLFVCTGHLLIDLPHGDFRTLKQGDSLHLHAQTAVLQALTGTALLLSEHLSAS